MSHETEFRYCRGFTLLEVAIVLVIIGYMLGRIVVPLSARIEQSRRLETKVQLEEVVDAVLGFAAANHRLPCPATPESRGIELADCIGERAYGFVPAATLGLNGSVNQNGLLIDSWGRPVVYAISGADNQEYGNAGKADFSSSDEMRSVGMRYLHSELTVCREVGSGPCSLRNTVANQLPLVLVSGGRGHQQRSVELENTDQDSTFIFQAYSQNPEAPFDDIVVWLSENRLFYQMLRAGVLP